jgi:ribose transport system ATP-binding protein
MSEASALLAVRGVSKRYGSVVALREAELSVRPGEIHALLGANGAGKSTLVKILSGVVQADGGAITVDGRPFRARRPAEAMGAGLATVFQDPALVPDLTIEQNLHLGGSRPGAVRAWLDRLAHGHLDFDILARDIPLSVLRLVDLARALARDPQLLMLDEITAALSGDDVEVVFSAMTEWRAQGRSVLFITHRLNEVLRLCDQATILRDGRTVASLDPDEGGERRLVHAMLGDVADAVLDEAAEPAEAASARPAVQEPPVVLEARDLTARQHLTGASFALHAGEVLGVVALEGQGQDRLFDVLSGDRPFESGELLVNSEAVKPRSPYDLIRKGVVLVPSDRLHALLPRRSLRENLASALYNRASRWFRLARDEPTLVDDAIARLEIDTRAQRQVRRLSGGNQQKVAVGRWLAAGFRTLLCFDPTRGIDIRTKEQIYGLLRELAAEGAAILYYTSEFAEVPLVCDRVIVMYGGAFVQELDAATADEAAMLSAAHGLEEAAS